MSEAKRGPTYDPKVLEQPCSTCWAMPGVLCKTGKGEPAREPHKARVRAVTRIPPMCPEECPGCKLCTDPPQRRKAAA